MNQRNSSTDNVFETQLKVQRPEVVLPFQYDVSLVEQAGLKKY